MALCVSQPPTATAQTTKIVWQGDRSGGPQRRVSEPKYLAQMFTINNAVAAFLANPFDETKLNGRAIVFEKGALFAAYPKIIERGRPQNILAVADSGHWTFIRRSALTRISTSSPNFQAGKARFETLQRVFPLKNNGQFRNYTSACEGTNTQTRTIGSELAANVDLGVVNFTFGGSSSTTEQIEFPAGVEVSFRVFGIEGTDQFIEIINYQACGRSPDRGQHTYDVRINGETLHSLIPQAYEGEGDLPIDTVSKRAKITCRAHRDAYHDYLAEDLGIAPEWFGVISSMTARWARGFVEFETC